MRPSCRLIIALALTLYTVSLPKADAADASPESPAGAYGVARVLPVGGEGRWDCVTVDTAAKLLYVPRQSHTQIIREETGEVVGDLKDTPGVHCVALAPDLNRGFTSNGKGNSVTVFNLKTLQVLGTIAVGENPDIILYEPASKNVFVFNGKSKDVTVIDAAKPPATVVVIRVALAGKPEFAVSDGAGHVFVNLEDKNAVAVIETATLKVSGMWPIEGGEEPSGLAIDIERHRLFAGCGNQVMAVLDSQTGKTLSTLPIGKGVDGCAFDPGTHEAFASCGDGTLTVVNESSPGKFEVVQTVKTRRGAKTMGLDPVTHTIYLPTAEFEEVTPADGKHPAIKPGTFMILAVSLQGH